MSNIFSYSKLETYNKCPQKYKLTYVDKIDVKEESIEAFVGKIVHEVLEQIYSLDNDALTFITFEFSNLSFLFMLFSSAGNMNACLHNSSFSM